MATILEDVKNLITSSDFHDIWLDSDREQAFVLYNEIRMAIDVPFYSRKKFGKGYRFRNIFAKDCEQAANEFLSLVFGWW